MIREALSDTITSESSCDTRTSDAPSNTTTSDHTDCSVLCSFYALFCAQFYALFCAQFYALFCAQFYALALCSVLCSVLNSDPQFSSVYSRHCLRICEVGVCLIKLGVVDIKKLRVVQTGTSL